MDKTSLEVSKESMQEFLESHANFMQGVNYWLQQQANTADFDAINHFTHLVTIFMQEACAKLAKHDEGETYQ